MLESPLRDQPWTDRRRAVERRAREPPLIEAVLRPGDCLYLPRGFLHAAVALGGVSTHLTIGVHSWTRYALAEQLMTQALRTVGSDPAVRRSLALGVRFDDQATFARTLESARTALLAALQRADVDRWPEALQVSGPGHLRAAPVGPLPSSATPTPSPPRPRSGSGIIWRPRSDQSGTRSMIHSRAGELRWPRRTSPR